MTDNLSLAIQISVIGVGLVFAIIILLWGFIAFLVRVTRDPVEKGEGDLAELDCKHRAAAAAVVLALSQQRQSNEPQRFPLPPTALVSAWQAVMRTSMLNKRGPTR